MKKILICILLLCVISLSSCAQKRDKIEKQLLDLGISENYQICSISGIRSNTQNVSFCELIKEQIYKDKKEINSETIDYPSYTYRDNLIFFFVRYYDDNYICGYINFYSLEIIYEYFEGKDINPSYKHINENFVIITICSNEYIVIDYKNNTFKKVDDNEINKYFCEEIKHNYNDKYIENSKEYIIKKEENGIEIYYNEKIKVFINNDYISEKSAIYQEIMNIVDGTSRTIEWNFKINNNELYIIINSELTMFGRGNLIPIVFRYNIENEEFYFVGSTSYYKILEIRKN